MKKRSTTVDLQTQINWLNVNLKKEIDERMRVGDGYRLAFGKIDERLINLEKNVTKK